jgi:hypothetical protein
VVHYLDNAIKHDQTLAEYIEYFVYPVLANFRFDGKDNNNHYSVIISCQATVIFRKSTSGVLSGRILGPWAISFFLIYIYRLLNNIKQDGGYHFQFLINFTKTTSFRWRRVLVVDTHFLNCEDCQSGGVHFRQVVDQTSVVPTRGGEEQQKREIRS